MFCALASVASTYIYPFKTSVPIFLLQSDILVYNICYYRSDRRSRIYLHHPIGVILDITYSKPIIWLLVADGYVMNLFYVDVEVGQRWPARRSVQSCNHCFHVTPMHHKDLSNLGNNVTFQIWPSNPSNYVERPTKPFIDSISAKLYLLLWNKTRPSCVHVWSD